MFPFHVHQSSGTVSRALELDFVAHGVPSLGYKTYYLVPVDKADVFPDACTLVLDNADETKPKRVLGTNVLENAFYRLTIDRATGRLGVFDKTLGQVMADGLEVAGAEERGGDTLSVQKATGRTVINSISGVELEENNPVRAVVRIDGDLAGVPVTQRVSLYGGLKRIDLENTLDWRLGRLMEIAQLLPYSNADAQVRYGIPFGSVAGSDIMPEAGPHFGDEVPRTIWQRWRQVQDWLCVGTATGGLTFCADRQLMILGEGVIRAAMLRSSYTAVGITRESKPFLRQFPPAGRYVFRYSLSSAPGDWRAAKSYRAGLAFSNPLIPVTAVDELSTKSLPPTSSFCSIAADNVVVTALKKAERGPAVALRVVEMDGSRAEVPVEFLGRKVSFTVANLLEEKTGSGEEQVLHVKPYDITTIRLH